MKPEFPKLDEVSPHAQEIEYALILQRMINAANDSPAQQRSMIYEFARAKLKIDTSLAPRPERHRLIAALEMAIRGVEQFSARREEMERLPLPTPAAQIGQRGPPPQKWVGPPPTSSAGPITPASEDILVPTKVYPLSGMQTFAEARTRRLRPASLWLVAGVSVVAVVAAVVAAVAHYLPQRSTMRGGASLLSQSASRITVSGKEQAELPQQTLAAVSKSPAASEVGPLPGDYGVYALTNGTLSELHLLSERVPDKRIAMSTPVSQASRTVLNDGKAKFVIYRRDLAGNAPERVDVRVVARVTRALTFDAKGKPIFSPVTDSWNIRNMSYEFRVRPVAGNPEMLLVQPEKADFLLVPGRYILVLKDMGYDFTISGTVTDPAQCLERTDASNGSFYSQCEKP